MLYHAESGLEHGKYGKVLNVYFNNVCFSNKLHPKLARQLNKSRKVMFDNINYGRIFKVVYVQEHIIVLPHLTFDIGLLCS